MSARSNEEERILRETLPRLQERWPELLILRNEANATTVLFKACLRELGKVFNRSVLKMAEQAVEKAYSMLSPSIKFGLGIGSPDVVVCAWGAFVGLEFKAPKGRQGADQKSFEGAVDRAGGYYFLVRSPGDAERALEFVRGQVGR